MTDAPSALRIIAFATLALWMPAVQAAYQCSAGDACLTESEADRYDSARAALDAGRVQDAIHLLDDLRLERAREDRAPNVAVRHSLAVALIRASREADARVLLDGWIAEGPEDGAATSVLQGLRASLDREGPGAISVSQAGIGTGAAAPARSVGVTETQIAQLETTPAVEQALETALERWRSAWEAGDAAAYLAAYAPGVSPRPDMDFAAWKAQRRQRVSPARDISVELSALVMTTPEPGRATVEFDQRYRARGYADSERKRLEWVRLDGNWRIVSEMSLRP